MKLRSGKILDNSCTSAVTAEPPTIQPINIDTSIHPNLSPSTSASTVSPDIINNHPLSTPKLVPDAPSPITACGKCVTCNKGFLNTDPHYFNKVTGEKLTVTENLNCKSSSIVYLIRCSVPNCPLQYIGQSINSLNTRCIQHRSGIRTGNEPKLVRNHFTKVHDPSNLRITPLYTVSTNDTCNSTKRKSLMDELRSNENSTMLHLNTVFPYGLNDRVEKPIYMDAEEQFLQEACIYKIFPKVTGIRYNRGSKTQNTRNNRQFDVDNTLKHILDSYMSDDIQQCRTIVSRLNVNEVTVLGQLVTTNIPLVNGLAKMCYLMTKDLCNQFRTREVSYKDFLNNNYKLKSAVANVAGSDFIPINFITKEIEDIGLTNIFNDPIIRSYFPSRHLAKKFTNIDFKFTVSNKYQNSIRSYICNYKRNILSAPPENGYTCNCHLYPDFINKDVGHVITGDVNVVANKRLRKLFKKGFSFIEPIFKNKSEIFCSLKRDITSYIVGLSNKFSLNLRYFDEWKVSVLAKIKHAVDNVKIYNKKSESILKSECSDLNILKDHFVLSGIDKANNNISFTCKKYYIENIYNELSSTSTYELSDLTEEEIVKSHIRFCSKYNIEVPDKFLPFMHMLPKFHKPSIDFRYIAAGKKSSTKTLSKLLSSVFKLVDSTLKYMDNYKFKFQNTSGYWVVKNKDAVISSLNYLNNSTYANSTASFDFKKLYTNLPHDKVICKISDLITRCFEDKKVDYIVINKWFRASWSNKNKGNWVLKCADIIEMFTFLINNIYVKFQGKVYKQVIGVPMGCDCAPQVADLFLFWYEHDYISRMVTDNNNIVTKFKHCKRYIDDLNIPNCTQEISQIITNDIYPDELEIVCTNVNDNKRSTFLDLDIIVNKGFVTRLYDKRRDFSFKVVTLPNLKSNIPTAPAYGIFTGELYRICKSCSEVSQFIAEVRLLCTKLIRQNFNKNVLNHKLSCFLKNRPACLSKYWVNLKVSHFN